MENLINPKDTNNNLLEFIQYIKYKNNINTLNKELSNNIVEQYIRYALQQLNNSCYKAVELRERRKELRDDIDDLKRQYVKADNLEFREEGKNTGGRINNVELRHIKILELQEQLTKLTNSSLELEASLQYNKELAAYIFDTYLNETQASVMKLYYVDSWSSNRIAIEMYYTRDGVRTVRNRAIKNLTKVILSTL